MAKLTPEFVSDGHHRFQKSALDVGYHVEHGPEAQVVVKFDGLPPERFKPLLTGLRKHFPNTKFWAETERQLCVFTVESDARRVELMRAFCAGFTASL